MTSTVTLDLERVMSQWAKYQDQMFKFKKKIKVTVDIHRHKHLTTCSTWTSKVVSKKLISAGNLVQVLVYNDNMDRTSSLMESIK